MANSLLPQEHQQPSPSASQPIRTATASEKKWPSRFSTVFLVLLISAVWLYFAAMMADKNGWNGPYRVYTDPKLGPIALIFTAMVVGSFLIGLKMGLVSWPTARRAFQITAIPLAIYLLVKVIFPSLEGKVELREAAATKPAKTEFSVLVHDASLQGPDFQIIRNSTTSWTILFNTDEEIKVLNNFPANKTAVFSGFEYGSLYFRDGARIAKIPEDGKIKSMHNQTLIMQYKKGGRVYLNFF